MKDKIKYLEKKFYQTRKGRKITFRKNILIGSVSEHMGSLSEQEIGIIEKQINRIEQLDKKFLVYLYKKGIQEGMKWERKQNHK